MANTPAEQQFHSGVIAAPLSPVEFTHPNDLWGKSPLEASKLYARAPWYLPGSFKEIPLIEEYVEAGELPDGTPLAALDTDDWARRVAVPDAAIFRRRQKVGGRTRKEPMLHARAAFVKLAFQRLSRTPSSELIPTQLGFDPAFYRTSGEAAHGNALAAIWELTES